VQVHDLCAVFVICAFCVSHSCQASVIARGCDRVSPAAVVKGVDVYYDPSLQAGTDPELDFEISILMGTLKAQRE